MADALLYRDGVRDDEEFFLQVYGVGWAKVLEFRRMYYMLSTRRGREVVADFLFLFLVGVDNQEITQAISHRADIFSRGQGFTTEFNIMFERLISWAATGPVMSLSSENNNEALSWYTQIMSS